MADPKPLTRDQLARFLPDQEAIRRFERLFAVAGDLTPTDVATLYRLSQEALIDANSASAKAQTAIDALAQIVQDAAINSGAADSKADQALAALASIVQSLELLSCSTTPVHTSPQEGLEPPAATVSIFELADVFSSAPTVGSLLIYDATLKVWKAAQLTQGTNITITAADGEITIDATDSGTETHDAPSKATPVDTDELPLADSASSFSLKKLTWANLKATLSAWINGGLIPGWFTSLTSKGDVLLSGAAGNRSLSVQTNTSGSPSLNLIAAGDNSASLSYERGLGLMRAQMGSSKWELIDGVGLTVVGKVTTTGGATFHTTSSALTDGAGAGAGTLLNAPVAGNPTKWIGINDNGTTRYIPTW